MEKGAATLKRVFLELGGKSAMIVLDDADFAAVLPSGAAGVHARRAGLRAADPDAAAPVPLRRGRRDRRPRLLKHIPYGDPTDPANFQGPLISAKQRDRRARSSTQGVDRGGHARRSAAAAPRTWTKGYYIEPTLFTDVDNSMTIAQEEIFGPVVVGHRLRGRRGRRRE